MVVKIQQSLNSSDNIKYVLIYNKDKSIFIQLNAVDDHEVVKPILIALESRAKAYFEVDLDDNSNLKLIEEVSSQPW
jgi:hypothetical protein